MRVCVCVFIKQLRKKGFLNLASCCAAGAVKGENPACKQEEWGPNPDSSWVQPDFLGSLGWSTDHFLGENGVGFRPQMGTSHGSKDKQNYPDPGYLQHLWPWGLCVYILPRKHFKKKFLLSPGRKRGEKIEKIISFIVLLEHGALLSSPPPDLVAQGWWLLFCPTPAMLLPVMGQKNPEISLVELSFVSICLDGICSSFELKHKCSELGYR